jgi:hypothetical protein
MGTGTGKHRVVFRIMLTPEARAEIERLTDALGITQIAITSKLVEWLSTQPDVIRSVILGHYPDDPDLQRDAVKLILERLRDGKA